MSGNVAEVLDLTSPDGIATSVVTQYTTMFNQTQKWRSERLELRNYIFATDTNTTSNSTLPWMNSTTLPILTRIRDTLHANYMAAVFPKPEFFIWEAFSEEAALKDKANAIQMYMFNKFVESGGRQTLSQSLLDYIDYGNCIADIEYVNEVKTDDEGATIPGYVGPRIVRISPMDIVINPTASSFKHTPKITRKIMTIGELTKAVDARPNEPWIQDALRKAKEIRHKAGLFSSSDFEKSEAYAVDGFGNLQEYYQSGYVELLEFEGDIYDSEHNIMLENRVITVIDRAHTVQNRSNPSWFANGTKEHVGWRDRPDNLMAMGPLDNLVGMQYRIDHLENAKADAVDLNIVPMFKIAGPVEEFVWEPGGEIHLDEGGDVALLSPDLTAMNLNVEIDRLESSMEDMAGAPKQAAGIRTPGEKTAFEVQSLDNSASRMFQVKLEKWETQFLEPLLNNFLESARRNLDGGSIVRAMDSELGIETFLTVTKEDITATGKLRPVGARHFAAQQQLTQNLFSLGNSNLLPIVEPHLSSKRLAELIEEVLGLSKFDIFGTNQGILEAAERERIGIALSEQVEAEVETPDQVEGEL